MMKRKLACIAFLAMGAGAGCPKDGEDRKGYFEPPADGTIVRCAVSGKTCKKTPGTPSAIYDEATYYFCCDDCPAKFAAEPEKYADGGGR
jgi:YHS domain-containing protein